jgi:hypothetical protein
MKEREKKNVRTDLKVHSARIKKKQRRSPLQAEEQPKILQWKKKKAKETKQRTSAAQTRTRFSLPFCSTTRKWKEREGGATKAKESEPKEKREMIMDEDRKDGE